ncbi:radical SAM protein [Erysipelotrichaceae bacterium 66-17]
MKKIALINPPYRVVRHTLSPSFPLGLGYIKKVCELNGVSCDLYDFSASSKSDEELINEYNLLSYEVIGISSYSLFFVDTIKLIKKLKNEKNIIVVGGHHATLCRGKLLEEFKEIDYCLLGFGEYSFLELIENIGNDNKYKVSGLCYRYKNSIIENKVNYTNFNLDNIPFPDRKDIIIDYDSDKTIDISKTVLNISTSRGCPYHCTYCVNCKNDYWLTRSTENVLHEVEYEMEKNQYKRINFIDCNFYVNPKRAENIIYAIHSRYPEVSFSFQTRSDQIVKNEARLVKLLNVVNCNIDIGIESNSDVVLKRYKKGTNEKINQEAIEILKRSNCEIVVYIIMFEALETLEDIRKTFNFLKENHLTQYSGINNLYQTIIPFYGSQYYEDYHEYYVGSIHERTHPKFIHKNVEELYKVMRDFRNRFEDVIEEIIVDINRNFSVDKNDDLFFLSKVAYITFEYYLIMCEKYSICDKSEFEKTYIYRNLIDIIKKYGKAII